MLWRKRHTVPPSIPSSCPTNQAIPASPSVGPSTLSKWTPSLAAALKTCFERAGDTGTLFPNVPICGIDPSVPMLKRGMACVDRRPTLKEIGPIEWVEGGNEDFTRRRRN